MMYSIVSIVIMAIGLIGLSILIARYVNFKKKTKIKYIDILRDPLKFKRFREKGSYHKGCSFIYYKIQNKTIDYICERCIEKRNLFKKKACIIKM